MSYTTADFNSIEQIGVAVFEKLDPAAQLPQGSHIDACFPVVLVKRTESRSDDTAHRPNEYTLGMSLKSLRPAYYFSISGTPELTQRGYFLVNSPVMINQGEEIKVFLYKFDDTAADLQLPFADGLVITCHRKFICDFMFPSATRVETSKKVVKSRRKGRTLENSDDDMPW